MVSFTTYSAAAVLAFSGMASAIPAYTYSNGTAASAGNSTTSATLPGSTNTTVTPATDAAYCPKLNDATIDFGGKEYFIECAKTHFGTQISISVGIARRAVYDSLGDCITLCSSTETCVGTAFDLNVRTCTLYSDVQAAVDATGIDFAFVVADDADTGAAASSTGAAASGAAATAAAASGADAGVAAGTTVSAGGVITIPVYSTTVKTVLSCAPTVTNCPLRANGGSGVVTELIAVTSTTYTCPAATTLPSTPLACTSCPYTPVTATQYSASSSAGTTSFVAVATAVVNYPMPTGTTVSVTVCTQCAASTATATGSSASGSGSESGSGSVGSSGSAASSGFGSTATSSYMAIYTGAADSVKAGMGFAAFVAGAAILI